MGTRSITGRFGGGTLQGVERCEAPKTRVCGQKTTFGGGRYPHPVDHQDTQWADRATPEQLALEELQQALSRMTSHKAPGPDEAPAWLDPRGELDIFQEVWNKGTILQDWKHALVVTIYKGKGLHTHPSNYRPISLLNSMYKLFAGIIQTRLANELDDKLRASQYGFRAKRSTRHPLFILRRATEYSNMTGNPLHLLFLDWKQAFDSVNHTALMIALKRFGVPEDCLGLISSIYDAPTFEIKGLNGKVAQGEVAAGIRQGCPLSPYLFIMLLTVILKDVDDLLRRQGTPTNTWSINHPTFDVEYADDTLLIGLTAPQLEQMLRAIETEALCYGMRLNATKTELLINECCPPAEIRFVNGDIVPTTTQAKCLGSMVSWNMPFRAAFKHRCALAEEAYKKLRLVWNSSLPGRVKLRIFQAIFPAVLTYGLDSRLTPSTLDSSAEL